MGKKFEDIEAFFESRGRVASFYCLQCGCPAYCVCRGLEVIVNLA
jgi:hypothetical protein